MWAAPGGTGATSGHFGKDKGGRGGLDRNRETEQYLSILRTLFEEEVEGEVCAGGLVEANLKRQWIDRSSATP